MSKGNDTGGHPGRQVGSHLSKHWQQMGGAMTGPMGTATHQMDPDDMGISMRTWSGPQGHYAEVEHEHYEGGQGPYSGIHNDRFVAPHGPGGFRTGYRAQIAAQSLANRVASDPYDQDAAGTARYESDSDVEYGRRRR